MTSIEVSLIAFACIFGGALVGMFIQKFLPDHHLNGDAREQGLEDL